MPEGGHPLRVGLTGGIACGKSHVLARLRGQGLLTLDLDVLAHEVMAPGGSAYHDVVQAFGPDVLAADGSIDRKALGRRVFADPERRALLNALVHPRVRAEEARRGRELSGDTEAILVTDAALLVEAGVHLRFDRLVVVHCAPEEQLRRLVARTGLDEASARARVESQMPSELKRGFAHFEIDTSGTFEETDHAVDRLGRDLRTLAANPPTPASIPEERAVASFRHGPSLGAGGIAPRRLVNEIAEAGGVEMERIARLLDPARPGPWYDARGGQPGPETLMAPVAFWALARRGVDSPFLLAAASSMARLTHTAPPAIADACLFALALAELAVVGRGAALEARLGEWSAVARRWGGESPSRALISVVGQAARRLAGTDTGGPSELVAWLVATATGLPASIDEDLELVAALRTLNAPP